MTRHQCVGWVIGIAWLVLATTVSQAQDAGDAPAQPRWREYAYGLSLVPPDDARGADAGSGDGLVRFVGAAPYTIDVYVKTVSTAMSIDAVLNTAVQQLGGVYPSARVLAHNPLKVAGQPAGCLYFFIPDKKQGPWVKGQAFVQLRPDTFVLLELEVDRVRYDTVRPRFEAMLHSLQLEDPDRLQRQRHAWLDHGQAWYESLGSQRPGDVVQAEQWFRIIQKEADIGYMRVTQAKDTQMGYAGLRIETQVRVLQGTKAFDLISHCFESDDGDYEEWSIRSTVRPNHASANQRGQRLSPTTGSEPGTLSWAETGVRTRDRMTVSRETLSGIRAHRWERPPMGYLSQVQIQLLDRLLPRQTTKTLGFYVYNPNAQEITFRTDRVEANPDGSYIIYSRPSPDQGEQVSQFDAKGQLVRRQYPDGRVLLPVAKDELAIRWGIR